jgi:hypothetical protein
MDSSSSREDPKDVLETEVLTQGSVENVNSSLHEFPTLDAYISARAACTNLIVISHIDINNELLLFRLEGHF